METKVIMRRELFGDQISQDSKTEFFSATDLVRAGNKWRNKNGLGIFNFSMWFTKEATKEFVEEVEKT